MLYVLLYILSTKVEYLENATFKGLNESKAFQSVLNVNTIFYHFLSQVEAYQKFVLVWILSSNGSIPRLPINLNIPYVARPYLNLAQVEKTKTGREN